MSWISEQPTQTDLEHTRGDSATIPFTHTFGASGNIAEARLMVRNRPDGDLVYALTLSGEAGQWDFSVSNAGEITVLPGDTDGLLAGDWFYDIELEHDDGTVTTFQKGRYYLRPDIVNDAAGGAMSGLLDAQLIAWTLAEMWAGTFTLDSDDVITTAAVVWPDGSAGTFTTVTKNTTFLCIDAFTVTHTDSGKTVTQAALTRNGNGTVTVRPIPTVA